MKRIMPRLHPGLTAPLLVLLALTACHAPRRDPEPLLMRLPAPPQPGEVALYAAPDGISVQSRRKACSQPGCFVFVQDRWRPLPAAKAADLPLLSLNGATGSAYSETLWREAGQGRFVLLNDAAGRDAATRHQFDGLRIGLKSSVGVHYLTVFNAPDAEVALSGGSAWLLSSQPGSHGNGYVLADLFALPLKPAVLCEDGVAIETSAWAGPPDKALSPDVFIARNIPAAARAAEKTRVEQACAAQSK